MQRSKPSDTICIVAPARLRGGDEGGEIGIDGDIRQRGIQIFRRGPNHCSLLREAFPRADPSGEPFLFDIQPCGIGQPI